MKDAKELLLEVLAAIPNGAKVATLFAADGVVELPFLYSVGIDPRYEGRGAIEGFYDVVKQLYPDFAFKADDIHILIETADQVFAEYTAHTTAAATGRVPGTPSVQPPLSPPLVAVGPPPPSVPPSATVPPSLFGSFVQPSDAYCCGQGGVGGSRFVPSVQ